MTKRPPITGCILAGGKARRLGGQDKGLIILHDRPLAAHVTARLRPQVDALMINANRHLDAYRAIVPQVYPDSSDDFLGPLAGFLTALRHASTPLVVTAACDSPFLPADLVSRLAAALRSPDSSIAVARCDGRLQPVFALMPVSLADSLAQFIDKGGRKIALWMEQHQAVAVDFDDIDAFSNINTPDDLAQANGRFQTDDHLA